MGDADRPVDAAQALKLLLVGDIEVGLAAYRAALKGDRLTAVPIGMHLLFLERAGQQDAATALLRLAVDLGADVSARAGGFGAPPAEAAAEYEDLIARGIVNSRMTLEYLRTLAELGRFEELARWLDVPRLLRKVQLDDGTDGLAGGIEAVILAEQPRAVHQEAVQSVRDMWMLKKFTDLPDPAVQALSRALTQASSDYLADWRGSDHPLADNVPKNFRIEGWALISHGSGYNIPHVHQEGWATGVYYPASPPGAGGTLHVGRPEGARGTEQAWGARGIGPKRGLLVLMPSFYTHWTVPLEQPGLRLSVAFDILPPPRPK
jgi:hypothetical protein